MGLDDSPQHHHDYFQDVVVRRAYVFIEEEIQDVAQDFDAQLDLHSRITKFLWWVGGASFDTSVAIISKFWKIEKWVGSHLF